MTSIHRRRTSTLLAALTFLLLLVAVAAAAAPTGKVNINTADGSQLQLLPRVGPAVAGRIIEFREENGPFEDTEELMLVRGIGDKTYQLIEPWVAVEGDTTLTEKVRPSSGDAGEGDR